MNWTGGFQNVLNWLFYAKRNYWGEGVEMDDNTKTITSRKDRYITWQWGRGCGESKLLQKGSGRWNWKCWHEANELPEKESAGDVITGSQVPMMSLPILVLPPLSLSFLNYKMEMITASSFREFLSVLNRTPSTVHTTYQGIKKAWILIIHHLGSCWVLLRHH